jgi:pentatricopeptide repeat protein
MLRPPKSYSHDNRVRNRIKGVENRNAPQDLGRDSHLTPESQRLKRAVTWLGTDDSFKSSSASGMRFTAAIDDLIDKNGAEFVEKSRRVLAAPIVQILKYHIQRRDFAKAKEMFTAVRNSQFRVDSSLFTPLIDGYLRAQRPDDALALMRDLRESPQIELLASPFNAFMTYYLARRKYEPFHATYRDLVEAGVKPTVVTFGLLIQAAVNQRDDVRAWEIITKDMAIAGVDPDAHSFAPALGSTARIHGHEAALAKLDTVPVYYYRELELYNYILEGLALNKDVEGIFIVYQRLLENTFPDSMTYVYALNTCCDNGEYQRALPLLDEIDRNNIEIDAPLLAAIAKTYCGNGDARTAETLLRERVGEMYVSLLPLVEYYAGAGNVAEAERVLADFLPDIKANRTVLLPLLGAYCLNPAVRDRKRAEEVFAEIRRDEYSYETVTEHTYMMQLYAALGEQEQAFRFHESACAVPKHNHHFPPHFLAALICFDSNKRLLRAIESDLRTRLGPGRMIQLKAEATKELAKLKEEAEAAKKEANKRPR